MFTSRFLPNILAFLIIAYISLLHASDVDSFNIRLKNPSSEDLTNQLNTDDKFMNSEEDDLKYTFEHEKNITSLGGDDITSVIQNSLITGSQKFFCSSSKFISMYDLEHISLLAQQIVSILNHHKHTMIRKSFARMSWSHLEDMCKSSSVCDHLPLLTENPKPSEWTSHFELHSQQEAENVMFSSDHFNRLIVRMYKKLQVYRVIMEHVFLDQSQHQKSSYRRINNNRHVLDPLNNIIIKLNEMLEKLHVILHGCNMHREVSENTINLSEIAYDAVSSTDRGYRKCIALHHISISMNNIITTIHTINIKNAFQDGYFLF